MLHLSTMLQSYALSITYSELENTVGKKKKRRNVAENIPSASIYSNSINGHFPDVRKANFGNNRSVRLNLDAWK